MLEFELLLELDALNHALGNDWRPLTDSVTAPPLDLLSDVSKTEFAEVIELWQDAFEWSYYDSVLKGILLASAKSLNAGSPESFKINGYSNNMESSQIPPSGVGGASLQAIFCIDEREDSIRRHIEAVDKSAETLALPVFLVWNFISCNRAVSFTTSFAPHL